MNDMLKQLVILNEAGQLSNFLGKIDDDNLIKLKRVLESEKTDESAVKICRKVCKENSYRYLKKYIVEDDAKFISKHYDIPLEQNDREEIEYSMEYLSKINDIDRIIKWCPMLMYLNRIKMLYSYSKEEKKEEEILQKICSSFREAILLADSIRSNDCVIPSSEMEQYIYKIVDIARQKKYMTESYSLYIDDMLLENKELLRRLS